MLEKQKEAGVAQRLWADRAMPRVEGGGLGEDGRASLKLLKGVPLADGERQAWLLGGI